jgi:hypothetical protein
MNYCIYSMSQSTSVVPALVSTQFSVCFMTCLPEKDIRATRISAPAFSAALSPELSLVTSPGRRKPATSSDLYGAASICHRPGRVVHLKISCHSPNRRRLLLLNMCSRVDRPTQRPPPNFGTSVYAVFVLGPSNGGTQVSRIGLENAVSPIVGRWKPD